MSIQKRNTRMSNLIVLMWFCQLCLHMRVLVDDFPLIWIVEISRTMRTNINNKETTYWQQRYFFWRRLTYVGFFSNVSFSPYSVFSDCHIWHTAFYSPIWSASFLLFFPTCTTRQRQQNSEVKWLRIIENVIHHKKMTKK